VAAGLRVGSPVLPGGLCLVAMGRAPPPAVLFRAPLLVGAAAALSFGSRKMGLAEAHLTRGVSVIVVL